jgi:capsular polysaccharide biosynthesis protein
MDALMSLAQSDAVAQDTVTTLREKYPSDQFTFEDIKNRVKVKNQGDMILVTADSGDSQIAAIVANTWAQQAVKAINLAYSGEQPLEAIEGQLAEAQQKYNSTQSKLEKFIRNNQITLLENRIGEATKLLELLQTRQVGSIEAISTTQLEAIGTILTAHYERVSNMEQVIAQAEALRDQIQSGEASLPAGAGDTLAILLARANSFSLGDNVILQPDFSGLSELQDTPEAYIADLDQIILQAGVEKNKAQQKIQELSQEILNDKGYQLLDSQPEPTDPLLSLIKNQVDTLLNPTNLTSEPSGEPLTSVSALIEETSARAQELNAELESQRAQELELTSERDIAWEAYLALSKKATEIKNAGQTSNNVTLASQAVARNIPTSRNYLQNAVVAGIIGILLGLMWIGVIQLRKIARNRSIES